MSQIIVLIIGLTLIAFIGWWFFGKHEVHQETAIISSDGQTATIVVNGGYNPAVLNLKKDVPVNLIFNRKDASSCLEKVIFPDFGVDADLPLNQDVSILIDTSKSGEFIYSCGMNMFHGKIIIK
ncbi:cupredoxin domain-containing protein [Enterococcus italicus]|uniref:cupredoxin domain-containing protein n=1 Tax=Enterococcus italicus TaxID=246144 RepID=UPI003991070F